MRTITYAGQTMVTGDDIAVALLNYAEALALAQLSRTVEIPVLLDDGTPDKAVVLIGPASEMAAVHQTYDGDEIIDRQLVAHFEAETAALKTPHRAIIDDAPITSELFEDL